MIITAVFEPVATYSLTTSTEGGANNYMVTATPDATVVNGKNMYEEGTLVTLTATENRILTFLNWKSGEMGYELPVRMDSDKEFVAVYSATDYIVGWDFVRKGNNSRPQTSLLQVRMKLQRSFYAKKTGQPRHGSTNQKNQETMKVNLPL